MSQTAAGRLPGTSEAFSARLWQPFRPPLPATLAAALFLACDAIVGAASIPSDLDNITQCPTEECRVVHRQGDVTNAQRLAVQLNQANYLAKTIMEELPTEHGTTVALDPRHESTIAEFRGITGRRATILDGTAYISINPATVDGLDDPSLLRVMIHEVGHYWWRIGGQRGNWLNEWGAIGMEVTAGIHQPPGTPPQCTANWSPTNDPGLHGETGHCVRKIGEYGLRLAREKYIIQHGAAGAEAMRRAYRALYGKALNNPELTPTDVGVHFARRIVDAHDAKAVMEAFSRLK